MATYWMTFRIDDEIVRGKDWKERYNALISAIDRNSTKSWFETTSFVAFESLSSLDGLAYKFKAIIAPSCDMFLLTEMHSRSARLCGRITDQAIFDLMPFLEAV
jgi:hypothetical protein